MIELLIKNVSNEEFPRRDNSDKRVLFEEGRKPRPAEEHREEWGFIENESLLDNISYQMQYLEFQILLYNEYQMYLTLESLHFKNIMATIGGIVESALFALVEQEKKKINSEVYAQQTFLSVIDDAYSMGIIGLELKDEFHILRKDRNLMHFSEIDYQEYSAYKMEQANRHIEALSKFIEMQG